MIEVLVVMTHLRQDHLFGAYNELLHYYPFLRKIFESQSDVHQLATIYNDVSSLEYVIPSELLFPIAE